MDTKSILSFLEELSENNSREWFAENKPKYENAKIEFEKFVTGIITEFGKIDKEIAYLEPKNVTYRIYRDTRFSSDKTPYKTNMGAFLVKGGKSSGNAGYYFHIDPAGCFVAGGMYMPMPDVLKKVRREIFDNIEEFIEIIENKNFKKHFPKLDEDSKLKSFPKDFPKNFEHIDYLKYKSYTFSKPISYNTLNSKNLLNEILRAFTALVPFNKFLNTAKSGND
jgi:uncharacterized protein (TIGR02453 family)